MLKKRLLSAALMLALLATFLLALPAFAAKSEISTPTVMENVYIYDQDNCIDDQVEQKLNQMLVDLEKKAEAEFAVISITSLNDLTIEEYANQLFNTLGIGKEGKDNGVLLLFSRSDNRVRLEIGRGLEGCLNDAKCGRILDEYFVPHRDSDKYTEATEHTVNAVLSVLCEEYDIQIDDLETVTVPDESENNLPIWIWILLIVILIVLFSLGSASGGSSGGGYYGGYSGGGFTGRGGSFGGGFSGGGGASR